MSGWQVMNGLAWVLAALLLGLMGLDFVRVERQRGAKEEE